MSSGEANLLDIDLENTEGINDVYGEHLTHDDAMRELDALNESTELQFQNIAHTAETDSLNSLEEDPRPLLGKGGDSSNLTSAQRDNASSNASICSVAYYQQYFDLTTPQFSERVLKALNPKSSRFFEGNPNPDLYGPFWITTTLVFLMAAAGNFSSYLSHITSSKETEVPGYDFTKISVAASVLYFIITVVPVVVWFILGKINRSKSLVSVICLYGYSLTVFVPACVLCVLPFNWLSWIVIAGAFAISAQFLLREVWHDFQLSNEHKTMGMTLMGFMFVVHATLAFLMKLYFFKF